MSSSPVESIEETYNTVEESVDKLEIEHRVEESFSDLAPFPLLLPGQIGTGVVGQDSSIGDRLLPSTQPSDLVWCTKHEPSDCSGQQSLSSQERGDASPSSKASRMFVGVLSDTIHCQIDNDTPARISRLKHQGARRVFSCRIPIGNDEVESWTDSALIAGQ